QAHRGRRAGAAARRRRRVRPSDAAARPARGARRRGARRRAGARGRARRRGAGGRGAGGRGAGGRGRTPDRGRARRGVSRPVAGAITGGIGAGKSEALAAFGRQGAATLSADAVVHELIANDEAVRTALAERFGTTERSEIAEAVFGDSDGLVWLEQLLHPLVRRRTDAWLEQVEVPVAAVGIPLH